MLENAIVQTSDYNWIIIAIIIAVIVISGIVIGVTQYRRRKNKSNINNPLNSDNNQGPKHIN